MNPNQYYISQSPASLRTALAQDMGALFATSVLHYGLVANDSTAATSNTSLLKKLVSYTQSATGFGGRLVFPNLTGSDVYWFNDFVDFRPGIAIDLQWCTWQFTRNAATGNENNAGALMAIRDCVIENGYINFNFPSAAGTGCAAIFLGARGTEGAFYTPFYDAVYFAATGRTLGNITLRNLFITSNAPGQRCIEGLGGFRNVLIENVWCDGQTVADGFYAEYGFATDGGGVATARTSSHGNITFRNCVFTNLLSTGVGVGYNGAYDLIIDGIRVVGAASVAAIGFGEAFYLQPWTPNQDAGGVTKRTATIRNVVGAGLTGSGIIVQGANTSSVAAGYLASVINALAAPALYVAQTDLVSALIDSVVLNGTSSGNGLQLIGGARIEVSNGRIVGFGNGINTTNEATRVSIRGVDIFDSNNNGINIGQNFPVYSPARLAGVSISDCFIAGSINSGISLAFVQSCKIVGNRFGYLIAHDGKAETTQDAAVSVAATATGVVCDGNYVAAVTTGNAYVSAVSGTFTGYNTVLNATGVITQSAGWDSSINSVSPNRGDVSFTYTPHADFTTQLFTTALTANRTMALSTTNALLGDRVRTVRTGLGAFTLTVNGTTVLPAGASAWCEHEYNGTAWIEIGAGTPLL